MADESEVGCPYLLLKTNGEMKHNTFGIYQGAKEMGEVKLARFIDDMTQILQTSNSSEENSSENNLKCSQSERIERSKEEFLSFLEAQENQHVSQTVLNLVKLKKEMSIASQRVIEEENLLDKIITRQKQIEELLLEAEKLSQTN
jgi:hypothetical protein